jgi:hypothetical protein
MKNKLEQIQLDELEDRIEFGLCSGGSGTGGGDPGHTCDNDGQTSGEQCCAPDNPDICV